MKNDVLKLWDAIPGWLLPVLITILIYSGALSKWMANMSEGAAEGLVYLFFALIIAAIVKVVQDGSKHTFIITALCAAAIFGPELVSEFL